MIIDSSIAKCVKLKRIEEVAKDAGIPKKHLEPWGRHKAKINLKFLRNIENRRNGKYIVVSAITPTPLGEGKTVTSIGLSMALNKLGAKSMVCLRQPSMGPVFGTKGGGTGGGFSQILPREDINLHFTGDIHAVGVAHNLLAAFIDNSLYRENELKIEPKSITWRRVVDINDRALRSVKLGLGGKKSGMTRDGGFDITVASEIMAILALSKNIQDMRRRLGNIVIGFSKYRKPVTADDLNISGAMAALLKDAIKPNLVQTIEHTPCFVHTGPFANIAHGNSSILADAIALKISDYVITESGFGADLGAEKFFNIKCRESGFTPDAAVIVCSIRALKMHSGHFRVKGRELDRKLFRENVSAVDEGCSNLQRQIQNILTFGIPVVVAINKFATDTEKEISIVRKRSIFSGASSACVSEVWKYGSGGGLKLANAVINTSRKAGGRFSYLYQLDIPIKSKIEKIATELYGAKGVKYSVGAEKKIKLYEKMGYGRLPVCIAKTHLSLSANSDIKGAPEGFILPVRDVHASVGAGFITAICGTITTMPGLPSHPIGVKIDIDRKGNITGLG
ncbi:MAG: formate--tetrahydrofolate ligase [Candidatus Omnitrophica bacterium]|nr:formate--tetrahydrofolate ligase [Candidatus Omnitrophota bacterium]